MGPLLVLVAGLAVLALAAYVLLSERPVAVTLPDATGAAATACTQLAGMLPDSVDGAGSRATTPDSPLTAAWGSTPIVLRCGVGRPAGLVPTSTLTTVDGVDWLPEQLPHAVRFTTVGRVTYVEVTVPDAYAPEVDPLTDLSGPVGSTVATVPTAP